MNNRRKLELDGRTTPDDLGPGQLVTAAKDCIGKRSGACK